MEIVNSVSGPAGVNDPGFTLMHDHIIDPGEDIYELGETRCFLNFNSSYVAVEGKDIRSYAELVQVIFQERFRNREFIEVVQVPPIEGG